MTLREYAEAWIERYLGRGRGGFREGTQRRHSSNNGAHLALAVFVACRSDPNRAWRMRWVPEGSRRRPLAPNQLAKLAAGNASGAKAI